MKILKRTQFGNPVLRTKTRELSLDEIRSKQVKTLIADMRYTLEQKKYGVGLAATQIGAPVAISVIGIKPTPSRPLLTPLQLTIINPVITKTFGELVPMWEGCISFGGGANFPYAQVPRYKRIRLRYYDEHGERHEVSFTGMIAHVIQHEVDHLNGILFVDRVVDTTTYMNIAEYKKRHKATPAEA